MAKAFEFRLEKLLGVRRLREEIAQREFVAAQQVVVERNRRILALMTEGDEAQRHLRSTQERRIDMDQVRMAWEWMATLERRLRREHESLQEAVKTELEKRRGLTEARKGVRVLERFRERH